jgi:hypothetical protein
MQIAVDALAAWVSHRGVYGITLQSHSYGQCHWAPESSSIKIYDCYYCAHGIKFLVSQGSIPPVAEAVHNIILA